MGYDKIILEGDALLVINNLRAVSGPRSTNGNVYSAVHQMLCKFADFQVRHVRREANRLANQLCHHFVVYSHGYLSLPFEFHELL